MLDKLEYTLCEMQGKLFEMSAAEGLDSEAFIKTFMRSAAAADLDKEFSFMQWAGEAYIMERIQDECASSLVVGGDIYDSDTLHWIGYLYRFWHYYTGESSKEILRQAPVKVMRVVYLMYHTMSPDMAVDKLKERRERK